MINRHKRQVKFLHKGLLRYGIAVPDTQRSVERGEILVYDSILPICYVCREGSVIDVEHAEYGAHVRKEYRKAKLASDLLQLTCTEGKLLRFSVGYGYAYYVVVRVNRKSVRLEWRGFSLERRVEPSIGLKGNISIEKCKDMIAAEEELRIMFPRGPLPGS